MNLIACVAALSLCLASAFASPISVFGTGLSSSGNLLPVGSIDPHWTVNNGPAYVVTPYPTYFADGPKSQWISFAQNGLDGVGFYEYVTTFDLTGFDPSTASLSFNHVGADNYLGVYLNGVLVHECYNPADNTACFTSPGAFTVNSGFNGNTNTIIALVYNAGQYEGLQLAVSGTATPINPSQICNNANQNDWTPYGQGYYCYNGGQSFVQCWRDGSATQVYSAVLNCAAGTSCQCPYEVECSNHGAHSPCV